MMRSLINLIAAAAAVLLVAACGRGDAQGPQQGALPVAVAKPAVKEIQIWDEYVGRFEAVNRVEIRPRVSGYLEEVHFYDGDIVDAGELLFTIDPRPFKAALDGAKARAEAARTAQRLSVNELARAKRLLDAKAGSQEEYDRRLQAKQAADADVAAANAAVEEASLNLEFTEIKSPIAGRAGRDLVNKGNLVTAQTTLLTTVVSIDPIHFVFTGSESDYLNYSRLAQSGERKSSREEPNPVRIKLDDQKDYEIEGLMNFIDNSLSATTGTIEAQAVVENPDGFLTPGMFGRLRLYGRDPYDAMLVPDAVVQFDQSRQFVWVVGPENKAQMRPVTLGRVVEDNMRIVEAGLQPDDLVITSGFAMLRPDAPVQPMEAGAPAAPRKEAAAEPESAAE
jgi:RND family efflux transporter MFP subunit